MLAFPSHYDYNVNTKVLRKRSNMKIINSQSLEDTQVGYISQKYSYDEYTLGWAFKPSYALLGIYITFSSI